MIKLYSLILLFSISFTQNLIEDDITSFIESLDDKSGFKSMNPIDLKGKSKKVKNWIFDAKN